MWPGLCLSMMTLHMPDNVFFWLLRICSKRVKRSLPKHGPAVGPHVPVLQGVDFEAVALLANMSLNWWVVEVGLCFFHLRRFRIGWSCTRSKWMDGKGLHMPAAGLDMDCTAQQQSFGLKVCHYPRPWKLYGVPCNKAWNSLSGTWRMACDC